nr:cysteine-rich KTR domain-containing protein [uncultured Acetatifactor sp.]
MANFQWVLCPICGNKTQVKVREDIILEHFLLLRLFTA